MPSYLHFSALKVKEVLETRLRGLLKLSADQKIEVRISAKQDYTNYASKFFQEHIINLVNNAVHAVRERILNDDIVRGRVGIRFRKFSERDSRGRKTGITFVDIVITDNGGGVPERWMENVGVLGRSTKDNG